MILYASICYLFLGKCNILLYTHVISTSLTQLIQRGYLGSSYNLFEGHLNPLKVMGEKSPLQ